MMAEKKRFKQNRDFRKGLDEEEDRTSHHMGQKYGKTDRREGYRSDRRNYHDEEGFRSDRRQDRREYDRRSQGRWDDRALEKARAKANGKGRRNNNSYNNRFDNED